MAFRLLIITTTGLLLGAGCRDNTVIRTAPHIIPKVTPPVSTTPASFTPASSTVTYPPVYGVLDSLKLALINYNGVRPLTRAGQFLPVVNTRISGGERDTIYFNGERWSHRLEITRRLDIFGPTRASPPTLVRVSYSSTDPDVERETFTLVAPCKVGMYGGTLRDSITYLSPLYVLDKGDAAIDAYNLDQTKNNWIEILSIDTKSGHATGRFSLHFNLPYPYKKSPAYSSIVLPNTIHMHGSFTN